MPTDYQQKLIGFYRRPISNVTLCKAVSLADVYRYVSGPYAKAATLALRQMGDAEERRRHKALNFDYVTFGGIYTTRQATSLVSASGYLCDDIDHVDNPRECIEMLKDDALLDPLLLFVSPSGDGVKMVVDIDLDQASYEDYYHAIGNYLKQRYGIEHDSKCKAQVQACFLPYDPDIYINPKALSNHGKQ